MHNGETQAVTQYLWQPGRVDPAAVRKHERCFDQVVSEQSGAKGSLLIERRTEKPCMKRQRSSSEDAGLADLRTDDCVDPGLLSGSCEFKRPTQPG